MRRSVDRSQQPQPRQTAHLRSSDFAAYLREKADLIASADIESLLAQGERAREKATKDGTTHPRIQWQLELALQLLTDHAQNKCPQIPYHTVSLLAVAVLYYLNEMDAIPDWLPGVGTADDALVFELAFELGAAGIERYCVWKGLTTEAPPRTDTERPRRTKRRRRAS